jgi:uncharacterized protein (DUF433 family)
MAAQDRWALYGGKDPRELPTYATWEAARYLRMPLRTVQRWTAGFKYPGPRGGTRFAKPLVPPADGERHLLSFVNLAELHVLDALRTHHDVPSLKLRRLIEYLEETFETPHPLTTEKVFVAGRAVFIEKAEQLIEATHGGQLAMRQVIEAHLKRIDPDQDGLAIRLFPFVRRKPDPRLRSSMDEPKIISIDPRVRYGRPVIINTSIPTAEIAERFRAGDSFNELAEEYGRPSQEIEEAIRCELTLDVAA